MAELVTIEEARLICRVTVPRMTTL